MRGAVLPATGGVVAGRRAVDRGKAWQVTQPADFYVSDWLAESCTAS